MYFLDFEKPIAELESKIEELRHLSDADGLNIAEEVGRLQVKVDKQLKGVYAKLTPWQKTQVARHPNRPHCIDYLKALFTDVTPLAGDRVFGEDRAIIGGLARFRGQGVVVVGQEKGDDTETRLRHNFGMAMPEGYRKVCKLLDLADRFQLPVLTLVDTAGAYPGVSAEERGQAEAIARSIDACLDLRAPLVSCVIGEGGSGGAIAIAAGNTVMMLEHSIYSVISPEGCASILWRSGGMAQQAAEALRLTAQDLLEFKIIDEVIAEPMGGAHRDRAAVFASVGDAFERHLRELGTLDGATLRQKRREKFLRMGREGLA
ncbi:acetyl-CoA carboxylase carboxyltransferase subunit alpha [Phaeovibrio sulfidiphilus]|uniref:Acetyl-coenzyme A carboxylase carboxyl transferase subunit alpha n=1 Tax=Phaeovibrio sulfidiphilus TaxID=1220600 RepID=A0A8J7CPU5_9PROT|nr:acetyl-CoA carboxylase carboxyltransferase subunit alpha [Phaeovibrio sulfidiphilus]MBE1236090.1 acetyl-CoA carboxylase carboxyltransferase subunit alpha [Phaeovibrio sulfidiphilus]